MRIALYGNLCNNLYQLAKAMRDRYGIEADLFIDDRVDAQQLPESDDPSLGSGYPAWIKRGRYASFKDKLMPWRSPLVREIQPYDGVVVSGLGPAFAQFAKKPVAFFVTGGDVTVDPFPFRFRFLYPTLRLKAAVTYYAFWQRRGIKRMTRIWAPPYVPFMDAVRRLNVPDERVDAVCLPIVIDTEKFSDAPGLVESSDTARELRERFDFIVFHPSRMMISDTPPLRATGQWKQNDLLFRAFAQFLRATGAQRAALVMIERPASPDNTRAKEIIAELGIGDHVVWLKPANGFGYSRDELVKLYAASDVVADDFGIGWFGSIVLEALAVSRPVLSYVDAETMTRMYPWHPLLSDNTVAGNAELLTRLYTDPEWRRETGREGRVFVEEFHSYAASAAVFHDLIRKLVA